MPRMPFPRSALHSACRLAANLTLLGLAALSAFPATAQEVTRLLSNEIAALDGILAESSGLAYQLNSLWTHNDSGDEARLFQLDLQGKVLRQVRVSNAEHVDWESMAHDADYLYIADTGNNSNSRAEFTIYRIAWNALQAGHNAEVSAELITIRYGDYVAGNSLSHNFDAEGLAVRGDELWLFSKNRGNQQSTLYRFPKSPGSYQPEPVQSLSVDALVTGADIDPRTGRLVLTLYRGNAGNFLWSAATDETGVLVDTAREIAISPSDQWEALVFDPDTPNRLYLTHENNTRGYAGLAWVILE